MEEHPELRLTYWHLNRVDIEQLWFYSVEDVAERIFDHCRRLPDNERITFCVEHWHDEGVALLQAHGSPRRMLAVYGWPENLMLHLAARRSS